MKRVVPWAVACVAALFLGWYVSDASKPLPPMEPGDAAATADARPSVELKWSADLSKALVQAKAEHKPVLLSFTGSDWCEACISLDKAVFSAADFISFASSNFIPVQLDFPLKKLQNDEVARSNAQLEEKYKVEGLPTLLVLNADGKEIWRRAGYRPKDKAADYIGLLQKAAAKSGAD